MRIYRKACREPFSWNGNLTAILVDICRGDAAGYSNPMRIDIAPVVAAMHGPALFIAG